MPNRIDDVMRYESCVQPFALLDGAVHATVKRHFLRNIAPGAHPLNQQILSSAVVMHNDTQNVLGEQHEGAFLWRETTNCVELMHIVPCSFISEARRITNGLGEWLTI